MCWSPRWSARLGKQKFVEGCQREKEGMSVIYSSYFAIVLAAVMVKNTQATKNDFTCCLGSPSLAWIGGLMYLLLHWNSSLAVPWL